MINNFEHHAGAQLSIAVVHDLRLRELIKYAFFEKFSRRDKIRKAELKCIDIDCYFAVV
jgi:hypothetical protein